MSVEDSQKRSDSTAQLKIIVQKNNLNNVISKKNFSNNDLLLKNKIRQSQSHPSEEDSFDNNSGDSRPIPNRKLQPTGEYINTTIITEQHSHNESRVSFHEAYEPQSAEVKPSFSMLARNPRIN